MDYYIREVKVIEGFKKTAGTKARDDLVQIFKSLGMKEILIECVQDNRENAGKIKKILLHKEIADIWSKKLKNLKSGDNVFIQFPAIEHTVFLSGIIKKMVRKKINIILFIHDLELLRVDQSVIGKGERIRLRIEEYNMLKVATKIVAHNSSMIKYIRKLGIKTDIVSLDIFDYLIPNCDESLMDRRNLNRTAPVIVAGNLKPYKAGYLYHLSDKCEYNLFGIGYDNKKQDNVHYFGSFEPDELPAKLEGSFGLVWDGDETETCSGAKGSYLKINNPHKTSLYLASEIPVIIWKEAALARFITHYNCGFAVDSIDDIGDIIANMSDEEYELMKMNTKKIAKRLRSGYYTKEAVKKIKQG